MKRTRGEKERWEDFEARVGIKQSGGGKKETHKAAPNDILVERMSILYLQLVHLNQSTLVIRIETVSHEMFDENGI